jgi:hypothetical protein
LIELTLNDTTIHNSLLNLHRRFPLPFCKAIFLASRPCNSFCQPNIFLNPSPTRPTMSPFAKRLRSHPPPALLQPMTQTTCNLERMRLLAHTHKPRYLSCSPWLLKGHSKWSNIKHDKARADASKSKLRTQLTREISGAIKRKIPHPPHPPPLISFQNHEAENMPREN